MVIGRWPVAKFGFYADIINSKPVSVSFQGEFPVFFLEPVVAVIGAKIQFDPFFKNMLPVYRSTLVLVLVGSQIA